MGQSYYPVALDLTGKQCLVVGGGAIAADKVEGLLAAGASVTVVSPLLQARLKRLAADGEIEHRPRAYRPEDLDGVYLVYAATDDPAVNGRVADEARAEGVLVNAVDDPPNCDFFAVAVVRRGDLQVAISTQGRSPAFARWTREYLDDRLPPEFGDLLGVLAEVRDGFKARGTIPPYEAWKGAIDDELRLLVRRGDLAGAKRRIAAAVTGQPAGAGGRLEA